MVNENLEPLRQSGIIGKSLDAILVLAGTPTDPQFRVLEKHREFLSELFIVSHVSLEAKSETALGITARHASEAGFVRCPRCWRWVPAVNNTPYGEVCPRCAEALNS